MLTAGGQQVPAIPVDHGSDGVSVQDPKHGPKLLHDSVPGQCETFRVGPFFAETELPVNPVLELAVHHDEDHLVWRGHHTWSQGGRFLGK